MILADVQFMVEALRINLVLPAGLVELHAAQ